MPLLTSDTASSTCYIETRLPPLLEVIAQPRTTTTTSAFDPPLLPGKGPLQQTLLSPYTALVNSRTCEVEQALEEVERRRDTAVVAASVGTGLLPGGLGRRGSLSVNGAVDPQNRQGVAEALESIAGAWQVHLKLRKDLDDPKWVQAQLSQAASVPEAITTDAPRITSSTRKKPRLKESSPRHREVHKGGYRASDIRSTLQLLREDEEERGAFEERLVSRRVKGKLSIKSRRPVTETRVRWERKRGRILASLDEAHGRYVAGVCASVTSAAQLAAQARITAAVRGWLTSHIVIVSATHLASCLQASRNAVAEEALQKQRVQDDSSKAAPIAVAQKVICKVVWHHAMKRRDKDRPRKVGLIIEFLQNYSRVMAVPMMINLFLKCTRFVQRRWRTGLAARYARRKLARLQVESKYLTLLQRHDRDLSACERHLAALQASIGVRQPKHPHAHTNPYLPTAHSIFLVAPTSPLSTASSPRSENGQNMSEQNARLLRTAETQLEAAKERKRALEGVTTDILNEHIEAALLRVQEAYRVQYRHFCESFRAWKTRYEFEEKEAERQQQVGLNYMEIRFKEAIKKATTLSAVLAGKGGGGGGGGGGLGSIVKAVARRPQPPQPPLLLSKHAVRELFASCVRVSHERRRQKVLDEGDKQKTETEEKS